jgi:hypothetical protein
MEGRWVAEKGDRREMGGSVGRLVAKLVPVARLLFFATAALWVLIQTSLKNTK